MLLLTVMLSVSSVLGQQELMRNADLEYSSADWGCLGCTGRLSTNAHTGKSSYFAGQRTKDWNGPYQVLNVGSQVFVGGKYSISAYVKLKSSSGTADPQDVSITLKYSFANGEPKYEGVVGDKIIVGNNRWTQLKGEFTVTDYGKPITELMMYISRPAPGIYIFVDTTSLTSLTSNSGPVNTPSAQQLLNNADFEQGTSGWSCQGCKAGTTNDKYHGSNAFIASHRTNNWSGPTQNLKVNKFTVGKTYRFSAYVKIDGANSPQDVSATLKYILKNGETKYQGVAVRRGLTVSDGWSYMIGEFTINNYNQPIKELVVYLSKPAPGVNILVDSASLTEANGSWKTEAKSRIESIRKGKLTINVESDKPLTNVKVKIEQLKHEFAFGSTVAALRLQTNSKYRQWYLDNFEWAVLENDMKWPANERNRGRFTWSNADAAMKILKDNGKKVRGHTLLWASPKRVPEWVKQISNKAEFHQVCMKRIGDIMNRYKGRIEHWDVNNEMVHHSFFKDHYGAASIRNDMFIHAKKIDPKPTLFMNDYNIIASGGGLEAYIDQANKFLADGVPVEALGAQCHFGEKPSGPVILSRLDRLASVGLPLWVTELDYTNSNEQVRAEGLEDALLAFFSHPKVNGVLFWGFWAGQHWKGKDAALLDINMNLTPAGTMWQRLFHNEWRSNEELDLGNLKSGTTTTSKTSAFFGDYKITVSSGGSVLHTENVSMLKGQGQKTVTIKLSQPVFG